MFALVYYNKPKKRELYLSNIHVAANFVTVVYPSINYLTYYRAKSK